MSRAYLFFLLSIGTTAIIEDFPPDFATAAFLKTPVIHHGAVSLRTTSPLTIVVEFKTTKLFLYHGVTTRMRLTDIQLAFTATIFPDVIHTTLEL